VPSVDKSADGFFSRISAEKKPGDILTNLLQPTMTFSPGNSVSSGHDSVNYCVTDFVRLGKKVR
jgi:hypothetical protein